MLQTIQNSSEHIKTTFILNFLKLFCINKETKKKSDRCLTGYVDERQNMWLCNVPESITIKQMIHVSCRLLSDLIVIVVTLMKPQRPRTYCKAHLSPAATYLSCKVQSGVLSALSVISVSIYVLQYSSRLMSPMRICYSSRLHNRNSLIKLRHAFIMFSISARVFWRTSLIFQTAWSAMYCQGKWGMTWSTMLLMLHCFHIITVYSSLSFGFNHFLCSSFFFLLFSLLWI